TKIAVGMVDDTGRVLSKLECPTDAHRGYPNGLDRIVDMLRKTARLAGVEISGIGIGSTGMVYPISGAFGDADFLPGWQGNNPVKDLSQAFTVTVRWKTTPMPLLLVRQAGALEKASRD